jgi:glycosyltransferase involved in cell wall biosynthesis
MRLLSVVIPTLNEAANLPATLAAARGAAGGEPIEFVVSDCDSRDGTADLARQLGTVVVTGGHVPGRRDEPRGRGGAGDVLLFLHADTTVPADFARKIRQALANPAIFGGAFEFALRLDEVTRELDRRLIGLIVFCNRLRYRYSRGFFGDQGVFVRRGVFDRLGGFPNVRLMEDLTFCRAMGRLGRTAILNPPMLTSPRRFLRRGVLRQFAQDCVLLSCDSWGVRPAELWAHYNAYNRGEAKGARL